MKKYMIHPGLVLSTTDGDEHYISASQLMRLYGVSPKDCVVHEVAEMLISNPSRYIHLYPRRDGDYSLPEPETIENN